MLGRYPEMSLAAARKARDQAREALSDGTDPAAEKRRQRIAARIAIGTTFGAVAQEYIDKAAHEYSPTCRWMLEADPRPLPYRMG